MYLFLLCENIFLFNCLIWSEIEYIVDVVRIYYFMCSFRFDLF